MTLNDYLLQEVSIGKDPKTETLFNKILKDIFSDNYYNKIQDTIRKHVEIKQDPKTAYKGAPAYYQGGNVIYVTNAFEKASRQDKKRFLLHEFIHLLQSSKSFFIFNKFKELHALSKGLYSIVKRSLVKPIDVFLTNKNQGGKFRNKKMEIVAYLMNASINWQAITPAGKRMFINELRRSKLFNLNSRAWRNRLS